MRVSTRVVVGRGRSSFGGGASRKFGHRAGLPGRSEENSKVGPGKRQARIQAESVVPCMVQIR